VWLDAPVGFGGVLIPTFASLREGFPQVTLELPLTDRQTDAVADG
jgi:DNA-binding transcriptional LysR family regulator